MKMWDDTTEDHIAWLNKAKSLSALDHFEYARRLIRQADEFSEKTKHMDSENTGDKSSILAAKFKNQYAIHRFLSSVLLEFSAKLIERIPEPKIEKPSKEILSIEIKKEIAKEVKKAISSYKKEKVVVSDFKRKM